jgi:hypothetical protein
MEPMVGIVPSILGFINVLTPYTQQLGYDSSTIRNHSSSTLPLLLYWHHRVEHRFLIPSTVLACVYLKPLRFSHGGYSIQPDEERPQELPHGGAEDKRVGRIDDPIKHFKAALRLKPEFSDAQRNLSRAHAETQ